MKWPQLPSRLCLFARSTWFCSYLKEFFIHIRSSSHASILPFIHLSNPSPAAGVNRAIAMFAEFL